MSKSPEVDPGNPFTIHLGPVDRVLVHLMEIQPKEDSSQLLPDRVAAFSIGVVAGIATGAAIHYAQSPVEPAQTKPLEPKITSHDGQPAGTPAITAEGYYSHADNAYAAGGALLVMATVPFLVVKAAQKHYDHLKHRQDVDQMLTQLMQATPERNA